jgi:nucleoid-associated protein YgaU
MNKCLYAIFLMAIGATSALIIGCGASGPREKGPIASGPYIVLAGDDLSSLALRAYDDMNLWQSLLNANKQITTRPRFRLEVGETLMIPSLGSLDRSLPKSVFPKRLPADYIIMPGDSLPFIAKGCYGDKLLWNLIYDANRDTLSQRVKDNPRQLIAGSVLHIPARGNNALTQ